MKIGFSLSSEVLLLPFTLSSSRQLRRTRFAPATSGGARGRRRPPPHLFLFAICSGLPLFLLISVLLGSVGGALARVI